MTYQDPNVEARWLKLQARAARSTAFEHETERAPKFKRFERVNIEALVEALDRRAQAEPSPAPAPPPVDDEVQVVGYTEAELAKRAETLGMIERLIALRALWSREDRELAAQRAVRAGGELAPVLPPPPPDPKAPGRCGVTHRLGHCPWCVDREPAPADDAPQTKRSAGCGLEPPPDTHRPFPLVRVLRPGVPHSRVRPSRPDSAPQPPTEPRQRPAAPLGPTRLAQLSERLPAWRRALRWAGACGW